MHLNPVVLAPKFPKKFLSWEAVSPSHILMSKNIITYSGGSTGGGGLGGLNPPPPLGCQVKI